MPPSTAAAQAHPNIALIKYWGNRDHALRLPANSSLSFNLDGLYARTRVTFDPHLPCDELIVCDQLHLNGRAETGPTLQRVSSFLDHVRRLAGVQYPALVVSRNNFPMGAGIASSAAAFAALALAATRALGLHLSEAELSRLARLGSGSACRSVPGGFVEWQAGSGHNDSYAFSIAPPDHWPLVDCITVLETAPKPVGSTAGHALADTSPLQAARVADTPRRLEICRAAILQRDFTALAEIIEQDSNLMHAVMMTSHPALFYWEPASLAVMKAVQSWRAGGLPVAYTLDAGPNVHVICAPHAADEAARRLAELPGVQTIIRATPGGPARWIENDNLYID